MSILLAGILLVNLATLILLCVFSRKMTAVYRDVVQFITPAGDNQPSPAAGVVNAVSESFARTLAAQVKSFFMSSKSAAVRGDKVIEADLAEDMMAMSNPALAAILESFPAVKKTLRRNPQLIDLALSKMGNRFAAPQGPAPSNGNGHHDDAQMEFKV